MFGNIIATSPCYRIRLTTDKNEWSFTKPSIAEEVRVIEAEPFLMLKDGYHVKDWYCDYSISNKNQAFTIPYSMIVKEGKIGLSLAQPEFFDGVDVYIVAYKE